MSFFLLLFSFVTRWSLLPPVTSKINNIFCYVTSICLHFAFKYITQRARACYIFFFCLLRNKETCLFTEVTKASVLTNTPSPPTPPTQLEVIPITMTNVKYLKQFRQCLFPSLPPLIPKNEKKKGAISPPEVSVSFQTVVALIMGKNGEKMDFGYGKTFLEKVSWGGPETPFCGISGPIPACGGVYTEKWTKF